MDNQQNYGKCDYCNADKVKNPKTGKIFCSAKCWLKNQPQQPSQPQNAPVSNDRGTSGVRNQDVQLNQHTADLHVKVDTLLTEVRDMKQRLDAVLDKLNEQLAL